MSHVDEAQLTAYLDQQDEYASPEKRRELGRHIADCSACMKLLKDVRTHRDKAGEILAASAPADVIPPSFDSIVERSQNLDATVEPTAAAPVLDEPVLSEPPAPAEAADDDLAINIPTIDEPAAAPPPPPAPPSEPEPVTAAAPEPEADSDPDSLDVVIPEVADVDQSGDVPWSAEPPTLDVNIPQAEPEPVAESAPEPPLAGDDLNITIPETPAVPTLGDEIKITIPESSAITHEDVQIPREDDSPSGEWDLGDAVAQADATPEAEAPEATEADAEQADASEDGVFHDTGEKAQPGQGRPSLMMDMGLITSDAFGEDEGTDAGAPVEAPDIADASGPDLTTTEAEQAELEENVPDLAVESGAAESAPPETEAPGGGLQLESVTDWESTSEPPAAPGLELESASLDTAEPPPPAMPPLELESASLDTPAAPVEPELPPLQLETTSLADENPDVPDVAPLGLETTSLADEPVDPPADEPKVPSQEFEIPAEPAAESDVPPPVMPSLDFETRAEAPAPPPPPPVDPGVVAGAGDDLAGATPDLAGLGVQSAGDMAAATPPPPPPVDDLGFGDLAPSSSMVPEPPAPPEPVADEPPRPPKRPSIGQAYDRPARKKPAAAAAPSGGGSKSWMAIAATVVIALGAGGAWWFGLIPGVAPGGGSSQLASGDTPAQLASEPAATAEAPAEADTRLQEEVPQVEGPELTSLGDADEANLTAQAGGPTMLGLADSVPGDTGVGSAAEALARQVDSAAQVADNLDAEAIAAQVVSPEQRAREAGVPPANAPAPIPQAVRAERSGTGGVGSGLSIASAGAILSGPMVMIEGLTVENISRINVDGRNGVRMIQTGDAGAQITVEVFSDGIPGELEPSNVNATDAGDGTASGTARWGSYDVTAVGPVSADVLRGYLERLVQAAGTD